MRVLVIEDEQRLAENIVAALREIGLAVDHAADLAAAGLPAVEGGQSSPRLPGHPEPGLGGDRPRIDASSQSVLADHERLHLPGGGELLQGPTAVAERRLQNCGGKVHQ